MLEIHPFGNFVPKNIKYLLLGSFTTKPATGYEWFYANGHNQFWPIMEKVYDIELDTKERQQQLFIKLHIALTDIILSCERKSNSNLDINLANITCNTRAITDIVRRNKIEIVYFTSRFVEKLFRKQFKSVIQRYPEIDLITLPSPSPRYDAMSRLQKTDKYRSLLPRFS